MATNPIIDLPSDLPPPVKEVSMLQMNDPRSPFLYDAVNSKKVDPPCIRSGEFMVQHADIAKELKEKRETLVQKVPDVEFFITHFENWGTTIASLLLYVKPKTRQEVCDIIKAAKNINIKVYLIALRSSCKINLNCPVGWHGWCISHLVSFIP